MTKEENETQTLSDLEYGKKHLKYLKLEMHTVGTVTGRKTVKDMEKEKFTWQDLEYKQKT